MFNPFKNDIEIATKEKQRKAKQEERRQRAQARGQKPIKEICSYEGVSPTTS